MQSAVVNFWNQKPSDAALESSRWEEHTHVPFFSFFSIAGLFCEKNILACCLAWWEKTICVTVFGPVIEKKRENTRALIDDGYNFNFFPNKEKPRFLSFSGCSAEGAPIERFVLASASHWCAGCWGFLHTIFLDWSFSWYPCTPGTLGKTGWSGPVHAKNVWRVDSVSQKGKTCHGNRKLVVTWS